jgi:hypothetical protein
VTRRLTILSLLVLAGCKASLGEITTHSLAVPAAEELRLLQFQLPVSGSFVVTGGGTQAMAATVTTNVPDLAPKTSESDHLRKFVQRLPGGRTLPDGATNAWQIRLGTTTPLLLDIGAGVLKGDMSLGGIKLVGLNLGVGVNAPTIHFDTPNLVEMRDLTVNAGAGDFHLAGLSRANVAKVKVEGGAGALQLDFAGELKRSGQATIRGGTGAIDLTIPKDVQARLQVTTGIGAIRIDGYTVNGQTYTSPGFTEAKPYWDVDLAVGVGAVTVRQ